ncbi:YbaN family protein [uncultured Aliivibrio sp.]|uniref:YbaN family protein n=1 Tax=uncultured Aliivibrio sp. TaxID=873085 RepID=UPI00260C5B66|nr:YbaN family protein [uncultured Aliivibrio sp.]
MHFTRRVLWFVLGSTALILGLIGIFIPLLPTTPFLLLASVCFMRVSPRVHTWLISHPKLGPPIVEWQKHKTIKASIKKKAIIMIVLSFLISITITPILWVKAMLLIFAVALIYWFSTIPTS